ncbi:uncharacterized protein LOC101741380 isoform X3 [Bombyx mori]|uniref:Uncharacterized protein n=1 Tax=Bombyx mori TaxID=7091 RepID=A0A8R2DKJ6_BOMMO|nr:uncharacterized protein LOC101741380 isoform X2 [Bombyx mori]
MENRSFDVEDILDLTDTEDTSSSSSNIGVYDNRTPLVMDIHEVKKDDPIAENSSPETKIKKLKKKKKVKQVTDKMEPSISSESAAEVNSLVAAVEEGAKEEFFDAHESYHVIPETSNASRLKKKAPGLPLLDMGLPQASPQRSVLRCLHRADS